MPVPDGPGGTMSSSQADIERAADGAVAKIREDAKGTVTPVSASADVSVSKVVEGSVRGSTAAADNAPVSQKKTYGLEVRHTAHFFVPGYIGLYVSPQGLGAGCRPQ